MIFHEYLMRMRHEEMFVEAERFRMVSLASCRPKRKNSSYGIALGWVASCASGELFFKSVQVT